MLKIINVNSLQPAVSRSNDRSEDELGLWCFYILDVTIENVTEWSFKNINNFRLEVSLCRCKEMSLYKRWIKCKRISTPTEKQKGRFYIHRKYVNALYLQWFITFIYTNKHWREIPHSSLRQRQQATRRMQQANSMTITGYAMMLAANAKFSTMHPS